MMASYTLCTGCERNELFYLFDDNAGEQVSNLGRSIR
jgi:hypothetical protein